MLNTKDIKKIIFLDIETTSQKPSYDELSTEEKLLFRKRFKSNLEVTIDEAKKEPAKNSKIYKAVRDLYSAKAPLYPEWGKIICISLGVMWEENGEYKIKVTSFHNEDEKVLLEEFLNHEKLSSIWSSVPNKWAKPDVTFGMHGLCAHNGFMFDFPFMAKRIVINRLELPAMFDYSDLKPWEISFLIDTKEAWKYRVFDGSTSLELMCHVLGVPTPKSDIDGGQVKDVFWIEKDLPRIVKYCEKDVIALATCYLIMKGIYLPVVLFEAPAPVAEVPVAIVEETKVEEPKVE